MRIQSLTGAWQFRQAGTQEWLPANVPGGVHTDLLALGRIPDPFVGDNERRVAWVSQGDWEYSRSFAVQPDSLPLCRPSGIWFGHRQHSGFALPMTPIRSEQIR